MKASIIIILLMIPLSVFAQVVPPVAAPVIALSIKEVGALIALVSTIIGATWKMSSVLNALALNIADLKGIIKANIKQLEGLEDRVNRIEDKNV